MVSVLEAKGNDSVEYRIEHFVQRDNLRLVLNPVKIGVLCVKTCATRTWILPQAIAHHGNQFYQRQPAGVLGDIVEKVMAASSIPGIFPAVFIDNIPYVDGAVFQSCPFVQLFAARQARRNCGAWEVQSDCGVSRYKQYGANARPDVPHQFFTHHSAGSGRLIMFVEPADLYQFGLSDVQKLDARGQSERPVIHLPKHCW